MSKINIGRVILGGIVAGIVMDILSYLVDGRWLADLWADGMSNLGRPPAFSTFTLLMFNLIGLAAGIATIWIYAAIRPRFGAGVKTAVYAGLIAWFVGYLLPNASFMYASHLFGHRLTLYTTLGGIVESVFAAIAGAALYREEAVVGRPVAAEKLRDAIRA